MYKPLEWYRPDGLPRSANRNCEQGDPQTRESFHDPKKVSGDGERRGGNEVDRQSIRLKNEKRGEELRASPFFRRENGQYHVQTVAF
jgi:hypothetical protein